MKTKELIALLAQCPPESEVWLDRSTKHRSDYASFSELRAEIVNKISTEKFSPKICKNN